MLIFNHSLKVQARNPKEVYVMDMGLYTKDALSISENIGRRLENLVFLNQRRRYKQIFYYKSRGECDFVAMEEVLLWQRYKCVPRLRMRILIVNTMDW